MLKPVDLESADRIFFEAIAGRLEILEQILFDRFVYRTTAGTVLRKQSLIQYLGGQRISVRSPVILAVDRVTTDATSVHRGRVSLQVDDGAGETTVTTNFLHVWVASDSQWQLGYREAIPLAT